MANHPSLKGLEAFEAAARTGSFAAAARELSVTPAAVSQLVRSLEARVGRKLFYRINRGITLTGAGLEVVPRLSAALKEINAISRHISGDRRRPRVTVSVPPSVAAGWLSLKIPEFAALYGPMEISLRSDDDPVSFDRDLIDIRLSLGVFDYWGHDIEAIANDTIFPVCSPDTVRRFGPFRSAEDLLAAPLIHTDWGPAAATFPSWRNWFEAASVSPSRATEHGVVANSSIVAINAAIGGLGIALCQGLLAAVPESRGQLVRPFGQALVQSQPYCLTVPHRGENRPLVAAFKAWLIEACRQSVSPPEAAPLAGTAQINEPTASSRGSG